VINTAYPYNEQDETQDAQGNRGKERDWQKKASNLLFLQKKKQKNF